MCNRIEHAARVPWEKTFPNVINLCTVDERDKFESYQRAKYAKNANQAKLLMAELRHTRAFKKGIDALKALGDNLLIVPIHSIERAFDPRKNQNAIASNPLPMAISFAIADETGWDIDTNIVQTNIVGHTGADFISRFAYPALFAGDVQQDRECVIVDDQVSTGSTVASCRGHIETNGGIVVGVSALTANRTAMCVRLTPNMTSKLWNAENFASIGCHASIAERVLGYPLECLTNSEANQIFIHIREERKKKPTYCLENFFNDVIERRKQNDATNQMTRAKALITDQKMNGSFIPTHEKYVSEMRSWT